MKRSSIIITLVALISLFIVTRPTAQVKPDYMSEAEYSYFLSLLDSIANDTLLEGQITITSKPSPHTIYLHPRVHKDKISLRWAPSDYTTWKALNTAGYLVLRIDEKTMEFDTVTIAKPLSLEGFKAKFGPDDDLAASAAEVIWGDHSTESTAEAEENMNPMTAAQAAEDLDQIFSSALLIAELRFDLAEAMAMGYTDNNVQKGRTYMYIVKQNLPDDHIEIWNTPAIVKMESPFKPEKLDVVMLDSLAAPSSVTLFWPWTTYTAYDIQRRQISTSPADSQIAVPDNVKEWENVNKNPYVMFKNTAMPEDMLMQYTDALPMPGVYEYRLIGYDSFGTASLPSDPHRVTVPDMVPPIPPTLDRIVVDHPDDEHSIAHLYIKIDTIEPDLVGYMPLYRARVKATENVAMKNSKKTDKKTQEALEQAEITGEWQRMSPKWLAPGDSVFSCDMSGLPSGDISIVAVDTAGNQASSISQFIYLRDYKAPTPPENLHANVAPNGIVVLRWNPSPDLDVRYYQVYAANDTTHTFMKLSDADQVDTVFADSIAPGLNQAFIYYEVRAVDYSGNTSLPSKRLQVVRPNFIPPHMCRIDSLYNDEEHVYMRWIQPDEQDLAYTRMLRRKRPEKDWVIIGIYPADSVRAQGNFIRVSDRPAPDMKNRYEYAMEAYNYTGVSSGLSLVSSVLHSGPSFLNLPITLMGNYKVDKRQVVLAWELKAAPESLPNDDWWYCIYRKGSGKSDFKFLLSADKSENKFTDDLLKRGESAEYYVKIRFKDGRFSQDSNIIKITAPNAQ